MRIGIELNGVLRDILAKYKDVYQLFYNNEEPSKVHVGTVVEGEEELEFTEVEEIPFERTVTDPFISLDFKENFSFMNDEEFLTFTYEDHVMELFAYSELVEDGAFDILNGIYARLRDKHDMVIVSNEMRLSKPATLFFLSKWRSMLEMIYFYNRFTVGKVLDHLDVLITADPKILSEAPADLITIKYGQDYNKPTKADHTITSLHELDALLTKITDNV